MDCEQCSAEVAANAASDEHVPADATDQARHWLVTALRVHRLGPSRPPERGLLLLVIFLTSAFVVDARPL